MNKKKFYLKEILKKEFLIKLKELKKSEKMFKTQLI